MRWKDLHNISIERKIVILFLGLAVVGLVVSASVMGYFLHKTEQKTYQESAHALEAIMQQKHKALETVAYTNMLSIASNEELVEALRTGDRDKAKRILERVERNIEKNTPFKTFKVHLHDRAGHAFLRSWKPDKYGDDLTTFRHTIPYVMKEKKPFVTTEVGKTGMTIRGIVPMFDAVGSYVGSGEFILSFDSFVDWMKEHQQADLLVLLDKKYQIRAKDSDIVLGGYVLSQKKYAPDFLQSVKALDIEALKEKSFMNDRNYLYTLVPIFDFAGKKIGYYLIGKDMNVVNSVVEDAYHMIYASLVMMALLVFFITGISIFILRKLVFKRLKDFQSGLLDFFSFFQKRKGSVKPIAVLYNDEIGKMAQKVNEQIDHLKAVIEDEEKVLHEVSEVVAKVGDGTLTHRIEARSKNETIQKMIDLLNELFANLEKNIGKDINKIVHIMNEFAHCNYTHAIPEASGRIEKTLNRMQEVITQMLILNVRSSEALQKSSAVLSQNVQVLNQTATSQFSAIEHAFALMTKINQTMDESMRKLEDIGTKIDALTVSLQEGEGLSNKTGDIMERIDMQVEDINLAIKIIDEIAFQTNILSLNAAVEAATAGEAGKGFAVVAQEVRNLASKSAEAAKSIKDQVENAREISEDGKVSSEKMLEGYHRLKREIEEMTKEVERIAKSIESQHHFISQINTAMQKVRQSAQSNLEIARKTEEISSDTQSLADDIVTQSQKSRYDENLTITLECEVIH